MRAKFLFELELLKIKIPFAIHVRDQNREASFGFGVENECDIHS